MSLTSSTPPTLARVLGAWDVATITIGTVMGSTIFIAAAFVPRAVPQPTLVMLIWLAGGLITLAGALTYSELGTMFPEAGGQYHYLKQAFGPLPAFLFGWISLLAIQSGGIAYLGVAFGEYLSVFIPWFSSSHLLASIPIGPWRFEPNGAQLAGVGAIVGLSAVNYFGVSQGARTQGLLTAAKVLALGGLIVVGLVLPARVAPQWTGPVPSAGLPAGIALALLAVFGNFDGWYQATMSAGEVRRPARDLPLGMIGGTLGMAALYLLSNWVYLRALPIAALGASPRVGEEAATALLGPAAGRIMSGLVLISIFGCISSSLVGASRVAVPMAQDRLFFQSFARVHPRFRTPTVSVVFMALWSCGLVVSGSYEQIFTYAILSALLFHAATGAAVWRLRRIAPDAPRPYRVPGYPWIPAIFVLSTLAVVANGFIDRPRESLLGLLVLLVGIPAYYWLRRIGRPPDRLAPPAPGAAG